MKNLRTVIEKNRSYRRFDQSHPIPMEALLGFVDLARLSASGANMQPLKFYLSNEAYLNERIFPTLSWAGYLREWSGPIEGERPSAYIIILGDKHIKSNFGVDHGIAAQSIMLGATEAGLGGCMIASIDRRDLVDALDLPENLEVLLVLALGKPIEEVIIEDMKPGEGIEYYRDQQARHHVPKRKLEDIIVPHVR